MVLVLTLVTSAACIRSTAPERDDRPRMSRQEAQQRLRQVAEDTARAIAEGRPVSELSRISGEGGCGTNYRGVYDSVGKEMKVAAEDMDRLLERGRQHWSTEGYEVREELAGERPALSAAFDGFTFSIEARRDLGDIAVLGSGPCYE